MSTGSSILISLTSVPRRFHHPLLPVLKALQKQTVGGKILLNIPQTYRKWDSAPLPGEVFDLDRVAVHTPSEDFGPATKLLGALEYARHHPGIRSIITVDDDIVFTHPNHLRYLTAFSDAFPAYALTFGGLELCREPYRSNDGIRYRRRYKFVDAPAGFRGALYPVAPLLESSLPFDFRTRLPGGIFHDDDAYFGLVLRMLDIPLLAIPSRKVWGQGSDSAVQESAPRPRVDNEMEIFQFAVAKGYIDPTRNRNPRLADKSRMHVTHLRQRWRSMTARFATAQNA